MNPILSTRFRFPRWRLFWLGRARLFEDRVELTGWGLQGRYRRIIPLQRIDRSTWWARAEGTNFAFHLRSGESIALRLRQAAGTWKFEVDALLGRSTLEEASLPNDAPRKDAAA